MVHLKAMYGNLKSVLRSAIAPAFTPTPAPAPAPTPMFTPAPAFAPAPAALAFTPASAFASQIQGAARRAFFANVKESFDNGDEWVTQVQAIRLNEIFKNDVEIANEYFNVLYLFDEVTMHN